jgi:hypothetical protein
MLRGFLWQNLKEKFPTLLTEDNIKSDLKEIWWDGVDRIKVAQDRAKRQTVAKKAVAFWVL